MPSSLELAEAACCIWEEFLALKARAQNSPLYPGGQGDRLLKTWESEGTAQMRLNAINLAERCHMDWRKAVDERGYDDPFDWDFVPRWISENVKW